MLIYIYYGKLELAGDSFEAQNRPMVSRPHSPRSRFYYGGSTIARGQSPRFIIIGHSALVVNYIWYIFKILLRNAHIYR